MTVDKGRIFGPDRAHEAPYGAYCIFADTYKDLVSAASSYEKVWKENDAREFINNTYVGILEEFHVKECAYKVKDLKGKVFDWCFRLTEVPLVQELPFENWNELRQAFIGKMDAVDMPNWNPVIWIRDPETEQEFMIISHGRDWVTIANPESVMTGKYLRRITLDILAGGYTFLDGSPICKKIEL